MSHFSAISSNCEHPCTSQNTSLARGDEVEYKDEFWKEGGCSNIQSSGLQASKPATVRQKNPRTKCQLLESFCKDFFPITLSPTSVTAPESNSRDKTIKLPSDKTVIKHKSFASLCKICTSLSPQVYA